VLPRLLSFALPLSVYTALVFVGWGVYRERKKLDRWVLILVAGAFTVSLAFRPSEHLLFFDEDIYIQIASNLSHAPVAQLTLLGGPGDIQASTYYKEPAGFPVILSLILAITGTHEMVAFIVARLLYAMAVAAVYLLGREVLKTRAQAIAAAITFAATPACFAYSASAGTDLPAALFAALGIWGIAAGNGMLALGGLAMASMVRLEMIALASLILIGNRIPSKWKFGLGGLLIPEIAHVGWVFSIAPLLVKVEHVESAFSPVYILRNLRENIAYLFDPRAFPITGAIAAIIGILKAKEFRIILLGWMAIFFCVYLVFYAGSFDINPRYSIQLTIPIILLAVSATERLPFLLAIAIAAALPSMRPWQLPAYVQALASDHRTAVEFAQAVGPTDLVVSGEPEIFMNNGRHGMNAVYATDQIDRLRSQFGKYKRIFYYGGIRTNEIGSERWEADRKVKSEFELHLIEAKEFSAFRIAIYELLQPIHREAG